MYPIKDFMTLSPVTVDPDTNLHVALTLMQRQRVRHLCVVREQRLVAIVSERDILSAAPSIRVGETHFAAELLELRVSDCMSRNPRIAHPQMSISEAAEYMSEIRANSLPVVEHGRLLGIVTTSDCIRAFSAYVAQAEEHPATAARPGR